MNLAKDTIQIRGMSCAACVRRIEKGLSELEGVKSVSVNFAAEKASLEYDSSVLDTPTIRAKIKDLGYDPVPAPSDSAQNSQKTTISIGGDELRSLCEAS